MGKLQWGDRVMLLFLNGKSGGDGGSSCGGAAVKKKISLRGVDNNCSKDGNVPSPDPRPVKKKITSKGVIDEISRLPDELLVSILSCLSLKEAVASSILSRRWRFLWTSISKLDFEGFDLWTSFKPKPDFEILCCPCWQSKPEASIRESWEYVRWVDDVLGLRNKSSAAIDELRISFSLHAAHQSYINRWIEFALDKKVVRLDMNLALTYSTKMYTFPHKLMCNNDFDSWGFKGLRLIRMVCVNLSDDALEIFLCSCPLLEEIFFAECCGFSTVKIVNSLSALKRLTIVSCNLESIEVRDSNLVYFMYSALASPLKHFLLKNVPLLVEMYVGGPLTNDVEEFLAMFSSCLPQLEKLTIHKRIPLSIREADMICSSVKMSNLKQLVWKSQWFYAGFPDWEGVAYLVGALPLLQRLVVTSNHDMMKANVRSCSESAFPYKRTYAYSHLKQVEFVGYHGYYDELAMLMHFVAYAAALEEVIIHPAKNTFIKLEFGEYTKHEMDAFRFFAKVQLTTRLPSTVTLKIL